MKRLCLVHQSLVFSLVFRSSIAFSLLRPISAGASTCRSMTASTVTSVQPDVSAYATLVEKLQLITHLEQSQAVLNYDQMVFMPDAASAARGAQLAALASVIHEKATEPTLAQLIAQAQEEFSASPPTDDEQHKVVALAKETYDKKVRIPPELEAKRAALSASAYAAWHQARSKNDFASFAPVLQDCVETAIESAQAIRAADTSKALYTVMLNEFERGMEATRIEEIFAEIETALVPLLQRVLASPNQPNTECLTGSFDIDAQKKLSQHIVKAIGFDETHGRIDVSVHPFSMSFSPNDVRITSRFNATEWYQGLAASIHESGHAMYEQNLGNSSTEIDTHLSMGCHESQSLFWERHVGLSKPFWQWASPLLKEYLGVDATPEQCYKAVNAVAPGLIRVQADELTYPLHVILRYRIEREMMEGRLPVVDVPSRWNRDMKTLLNVDVPNDAQGCLQDIHWSSLAIGYFPTYLLGSATAAQLAHYCKNDIKDFDEKIATGEFAPIKAWLKDKIHRHGRRYASLDALLEDQVGEKLNPKYFIDYLTKKYSDIYQC